MPIFKQGFLGHDNALDLDRGFFQSVASGGCLLLLRDKLGLVKGLLLVETLDLLVHGVDQQILLFLNLFKVSDVLFGTVSCTSGQSQLGLHDLIVLFDLLKSAVKLIELILSLQHSLELLVGLLLFSFVLALENFVLALGLDTVPLNDVVVVMSAFKSSLHLGELVLDTVQLNTGVFTGLAHFAHFFLLLAESEVNTLVLIS